MLVNATPGANLFFLLISYYLLPLLEISTNLIFSLRFYYLGFIV